MKSISNQIIRYSQCWEDANLLLATLTPGKGDVVISIASAGDNTLSLLSQSPDRVIAVDLSSAQLYLLELKMACFRHLLHGQTLTLLGVSRGERESDGLKDLRLRLYQKIRPHLSAECAAYFDVRTDAIKNGINNSGKLERYFSIFRRYVLPLVHSQATVEQLFLPRTDSEMASFYQSWNSPAYRLFCKMFFSRPVLKLLGREKSFFDYASDSLSTFIARATHSHILNGSARQNPYLRYILTGRFGDSLPHYLQPANYDAIRANLDKLTIRQGSLVSVLEEMPAGSVSAFNLSDVFEYLDLGSVSALTGQIVRVSRCKARVAYWNMLVDREMQDYSGGQTTKEVVLESDLPQRSDTFFYKRFVFERVMA